MTNQTLKKAHEDKRKNYNREPTPEDREAYIAKWGSQGYRVDNGDVEIDYFLRVRRFREPNDAGPGAQKNKGIRGLPPKDSTFRCIGICRVGERAGQRCFNWACKASQYCYVHGGRNRYVKAYVAAGKKKRHAIGQIAEAKYRNLQRLPVVYSKYLSESLAERLQDLCARPLREQVNVIEELNLMKVAASDSAQLYDFVQVVTQEQLDKLETLDNGVEAKRKTVMDVLQQRVAAGQIMKEAMQQVIDTSEQVQRIASDKRTTIAVQDLALLVSQFVEIIYDELGDAGVDQAARIAERIRQVKLPRDGNEGTSITPDMDVIAMDNTVPKIAG